jgi:hypothetical protein
MIGVISKYGKWSREPEYFKGVGHEGHEVGMPLLDVPFEVPLVAEGILLIVWYERKIQDIKDVVEHAASKYASTGRRSTESVAAGDRRKDAYLAEQPWGAWE